MKENLTAKRINMLEKARELHGFTNVWSQVGKIIIFGKTINKFKVFGRCGRPIMGRKNFISFTIFLPRVYYNRLGDI